MGVRITIRDVGEDVRDQLAARAARERISMQRYLKRELERLVRQPSMAEWLEAVRRRKESTGRRISAKDILGHRDSDRT